MLSMDNTAVFCYKAQLENSWIDSVWMIFMCKFAKQVSHLRYINNGILALSQFLDEQNDLFLS